MNCGISGPLQNNSIGNRAQVRRALVFLYKVTIPIRIRPAEDEGWSHNVAANEAKQLMRGSDGNILLLVAHSVLRNQRIVRTVGQDDCSVNLGSMWYFSSTTSIIVVIAHMSVSSLNSAAEPDYTVAPLQMESKKVRKY